MRYQIQNLKLKARIVELFGSQIGFCLQVQENPSIVSEIVTGRRNIDEERKRVWSAALNTDIDTLMEATK